MMRPRSSLPLIVGALLLASGCAPTPERAVPQDPRGAWEQRIQALDAIPVWGLQGRVAARRADEGWSAGLDWQQNGDRVRVALSGPLGRRVAVLEGRPGHYELSTSNGGFASAPSAESLMAEVLGWTLPVSGLRYWVRGLPDPEGSGPRPAVELDPYGRPLQLDQDGWRITYERYDDGVIAMPLRLTLVRGPIRIKMVAKRWHLTSL